MTSCASDSSEEITSSIGPFDWSSAGHAIVKAGEAIGWNLGDVEKFVKRVQLIEYGLSSEVEFAAILSWLGRCSLAHRLDQDCFSSSPKCHWCVPDLLAVIDHCGVEQPVLIEVKTRNGLRLRVSTKELRSMRRYAVLSSLPLLYAWKPRPLGFWLLVDHTCFEQQGDKSVLTLNAAMQDNLFSTVAGDFMIVPKAGAGLFLEATMVGELRRTEQTTEGVIHLTNAEFRDASGKRAELPGPLLPFLCSCSEEVDTLDGDRHTKAFVVQDRPVYAQQVLRAAVAIGTSGKKSPIQWRHVANDLSSYLSRESLNNAVTEGLGTFVSYGLFQHPVRWPDSLPPRWNAIPTPGGDDSGTDLSVSANQTAT